ncbi:MAG: penicillin acylase family protein [Acidobacteriota bacterium]
MYTCTSAVRRFSLKLPIVSGFPALLLIIFALSSAAFAVGDAAENARWQRHSANVSIVRDDWGIAHVAGKTDSDAVFGAIYAQAEDDFNRIEVNYLNSLGRMAEAEGGGAVWNDLRQRMFVDSDKLKTDYAASPAWLQKLMTAWADGLNFYLSTHPATKPRVLTHFEPWMALSFTEGSIGGDIESINLKQLAAFYGGDRAAAAVADNTAYDPFKEPTGSNGIAIAPSNTKNKHALLLINPHTSFFFRSELQMTSREGLNAYGASTWGQFFIYQGFNDNCAWMHTTSAADRIDEFLETVVTKGGQSFYSHGGRDMPFTTSEIKLSVRTKDGSQERTFTVYRTPHGPVVRKLGDKWVTVSLMNKPVDALVQSYSRTKARNLDEFKYVMQRHANSSNNTIYADRDGHIAFFHVNYMPRRDPRFDWTKPVDGSDPATDYKGLLTFEESPNLIDPRSGWLYNSNNWPWSNAGRSSLRQADYPKYVDNGVESARGLHAIKVLENKRDFTLETLRAAAYDSYLTWFDKPLPALIKAWDSTPAASKLKTRTSEQLAMLKAWDHRWSVDSVPTSLAIFWGEDMVRRIGADAQRAGLSAEEYIATRSTPDQMLQSFAAASDRLTADFGKWRTPWGEINRFQRLNDDIVNPFSDAAPSIPVGFTSSIWGSLASFGARPYNGSKRIYGTNGNSFVAVVEFGPKIRARAITAGGESGDPNSKHFDDQAERYATGNLRDVYFYPAQLEGHTERQYRPGE